MREFVQVSEPREEQQIANNDKYEADQKREHEEVGGGGSHNARLNGQAQVTNIKCNEGHAVRYFPQGYRKLRKNARGIVCQPNFSSFTCQACLQTIVLSEQGYFSCDQICDFDLCRSCMTCSIDGNLLYETFDKPSQDTIKWQQFCVQTTSENYFETSTRMSATEGSQSHRNNGLLSTPRQRGENNPLVK